MLGTSDVLRALAIANPDANVTEDKLRRVLRRGLIPSLGRLAGRLVWTPDEVQRLAEELDLAPPGFDDDRNCLAAAT